MSATTATALMTTEEFLALPDDGIERDLIRGVVRTHGVPGEDPITRRNRFHSSVEAEIVYQLKAWLKRQPQPRGQVYSGEAGFILGQVPDTVVGIDVAYAASDVVTRQTDESLLIVGPPVLAVEILSPSDRKEEIDEKIRDYLSNAVALVWLVDPTFQTVTVHRPDARPILFNADQELTAEPHLPGFRVAVGDLFRS